MTFLGPLAAFVDGFSLAWRMWVILLQGDTAPSLHREVVGF
jgi:hypothetical protein